jgi:GR25 family glycosyltransferase involved in LPS biosynthesis
MLTLLPILILSCAISRTRSSNSSKLPINVINLERDTTRWETLVRDLTNKGVEEQDIQRLPAVYGKTLSKRELETKTTRRARLFCTPGMIGCYLSHVKFWWKVASEPESYQMVLEDDAVVSENFHEKAQQMIDELQDNPETKDNWDVLLLGAFSCVHPERKYGKYRPQAWLLGDGRKQRRVTQHIQIPHRPLGTHAYILSQRGARKLLNRASKATWHVDCVVWGIRELDLFICDPMLVFQDTESPSTVGAVTTGIETWLPKWKMDDYTGASFEWAMNEPFLRVPILGITMSIGRYISLLSVGTIAGLLLRGKTPAWILPAHVGAFVGFAVAFVRIMKIPEGILDGGGELLEATAAVVNSQQMSHIIPVATAAL